MTITKERTVGEIVSENIKAADIFKKFNIDFCCGGGISIEKACQKKGVSSEELLEALSILNSTDISRTYNYKTWSADFLIDHIINVHHSYVSESIPILMQYAHKVAQVHGHHYTEVLEIYELFTEVAEELSQHLLKEERVLFPYIKQMVEIDKEGGKLPPVHFGSVQNPVRMMEHEHENAGDVFKRIAEITHNYMPPEGACNTFRALYAKLSEFEQDLHLHIHLENNILHKKALALEEKLSEN